MPNLNLNMFVQSSICQVLTENNSTKFLTSSKVFANFFYNR